MLKGLKVDTLYMVGGLTDVCIHYTAVDAHQHDYHIRIVTDAVAGSGKEAILGNKGCNCSKMVFEKSFWQPEVTEGVLGEESLEILKKYFGNHEKG